MSRLEIREVTDDAGIAEYERLNRRSPQGSVFSSVSWMRYREIESRLFGVYKGSELVAGALVPVAGGKVLRLAPGTPWTGPVSRNDDEGENLAVAEGLAGHLLRAYEEVTLTLPPEWTDVRGFAWSGMRQQVRYTYRGEHPEYEKRTRFRPCFVKVASLHLAEDWQVVSYETADSTVTMLRDWKRTYYWKANPGGSWHSECLNSGLRDGERDGLPFDLVGCNSPKRGLFKRQFGGTLTPYYVVTTCDPKEIADFWPPQEAAVA